MIYTYAPLTGGLILRWAILNLVLNTFFGLYFWAATPDSSFIWHFLYSQINGTTIFAFSGFALVVTKHIPPRVRLFAILVICLMGAAAGVLQAFIIMRIPGFPYDLFMLSFMINSLIVSFIVGFLYYWERIGQTRGRIRQEQLRQLNIEKSIVQARLKLIQTRLDPDFLFNILEQILKMLDSDLERAKAMQLALIRYLRLSLSGFRTESTTVEQEVAIIDAYLKIFKSFPEMALDYRIDVTDDLRDHPIPPMLIQSLVGRMVNHRREPGAGSPCIHVRGGIRDGRIGFEVADTAAPADPVFDLPGLVEPVRRRIEELFGEKGCLTVERLQAGQGGIMAAISIPVTHG